MPKPLPFLFLLRRCDALLLLFRIPLCLYLHFFYDRDYDTRYYDERERRTPRFPLLFVRLYSPLSRRYWPLGFWRLLRERDVFLDDLALLREDSLLRLETLFHKYRRLFPYWYVLLPFLMPLKDDLWQLRRFLVKWLFLIRTDFLSRCL